MRISFKLEEYLDTEMAPIRFGKTHLIHNVANICRAFFAKKTLSTLPRFVFLRKFSKIQHVMVSKVFRKKPC